MASSNSLFDFNSIINYLNERTRIPPQSLLPDTSAPISGAIGLPTLAQVTANRTGVAGKPGEPTVLNNFAEGVLNILGGVMPRARTAPTHQFRSAPGVAESLAMNPARIPGQSGFGALDQTAIRPGSASRFDIRREAESFAPRGPTSNEPQNRVTVEQVTDWLNQAGIPHRVETRGEYNTRYVIAQDQNGRNITIRVPGDRHIGISGSGVGRRFDTGDVLAGPTHREDIRHTQTIGGERYSDPQVLFDALTHRLPYPQIFRLTPPDRIPHSPIPPPEPSPNIRTQQPAEQLEFFARLGARPAKRKGPEDRRRIFQNELTTSSAPLTQVPGAPYSWSRSQDNYIVPFSEMSSSSVLPAPQMRLNQIMQGLRNTIESGPVRREPVAEPELPLIMPVPPARPRARRMPITEEIQPLPPEEVSTLGGVRIRSGSAVEEPLADLITRRITPDPRRVGRLPSRRIMEAMESSPAVREYIDRLASRRTRIRRRPITPQE